MNPYRIDREGKDCNSDGELSCLCLAFSTPSPTPHCQVSHADSLCCSSPALIHLHLCCSPPLCTILFCPPPSLPHTLPCLSPLPISDYAVLPALSLACSSPTHVAFLCGFSLLHMLPSILCASPSIHKHTQGQICTNLGILALVSLPVKLLFLHIRPRQECRDIYETLFNVLKSHRLEHLGN